MNARRSGSGLLGLLAGLGLALLGLPLLALVVRDEDSDVDQDAVLAALAERFATWQLPDEVRFVTEIDRTGVGKVNKRKLRADYADALTSGR